MKRIGSWVGGALVAVVLGLVVVRPAIGAKADKAQNVVVQYVNPAPMAPKHPYKIPLTGGASACFKLQLAGQRFEVDCNVDCSWDVAQFLPDAGYNIPFTDGGVGIFAETIDGNQLAAATNRVQTMPNTMDSVCVYSASAGSAYVSETYP